MSRSTKTLIQLRGLILNGELAPGERLVETSLVERLGVSRTPIRAALARLADEGLIEQLASGGYTVREFSQRDIQDAIEVRGCIEGIAARFAAERGISDIALGKIKQDVFLIDKLLDKTDFNEEDISTYLDLNDQFHRHLIALPQSFVVERMLDRSVTLPFAATSSFVIVSSEVDSSWQIFFVAQEQHRSIVEAIEYGEGLRAEMLAREHAYLSLQTLRAALKQQAASLEDVPGYNMISGIG